MSINEEKMNQFKSGCSGITIALSGAANLIDQIRFALGNSNQFQTMIQVSQPQNPGGQSPYKVTFRAVANRSISNYDWSTNPIAGIVDPPAEYATYDWSGSGPGQKTVNLTVTDFEGNTQTASLNITLQPSSALSLNIPAPTTNENAKYIFLPETVNFIPPAGNRYTYYATAGSSGDAGYSQTPIFTGDGVTPMPDGRFILEIGHDFYDFQLLQIDEDNSENVITSKRYNVNQNGEANLAYTGQRSDNPNISTYQATTSRPAGTYYWDFFFREGDVGLFKNAGDNGGSTGTFGWDDTGNNQYGATVGFTGNLYIKAVLMSNQTYTALGEATVIHVISQSSTLPPVGESYPVSQDIGPGVQNIHMDRFDIPSAPANDQTWDYIVHGEIMWTDNFDSTLYFAYQTDQMYEDNSGYVSNRKGIEVPLDGQYHPFSSYPFSVKNRNVVVGFGGLNNAPSARLRNVRLIRRTN